jgi:hypothetical protein
MTLMDIILILSLHFISLALNNILPSIYIDVRDSEPGTWSLLRA